MPIELDPDDAQFGVEVSGDHVVIPAAAYQAYREHQAAAWQRQNQARLAAVGFADWEDLASSLEEAHRASTAQEPTMPPTPTRPAATPGSAAPGTTAPKPPVAAAGAPGAPAADPASDRTLPENVRRKVNQYRDEAAKKAKAAEERAIAAERALEETRQQIARHEAETEMRLELARSGMSDLGYGWFELQKQIAQMAADQTPEGIEKFKKFSEGGVASAKAWAEEQRKTRPYLFGTAPVPATTGAVGAPGSQPAPGQPSAPAVTGAAVGAGQFNSLGAAPQDFERHMRDLGINYQGSQPPPRR